MSMSIARNYNTAGNSTIEVVHRNSPVSVPKIPTIHTMPVHSLVQVVVAVVAAVAAALAAAAAAVVVIAVAAIPSNPYRMTTTPTHDFQRRILLREPLRRRGYNNYFRYIKHLYNDCKG
jgi:hypothetical protein